MVGTVVASIARVLSRRCGIHLARLVIRAPLEERVVSARCEVRCKSVELAQLLPWCADPELEISEAQVHAAFGRGDRCVGAYMGERLVGYIWIANGPTPHVAGLWVQIDPSDCYFYKKFVRPAARGLRIGDALDTGADNVALQLGYSRLVGFVDLQNTAAWKGLRRRMGSTAGYVGYVTWFRRPTPFRTWGAARYRFGFFKPRN